jgi:hypothetical protein
VVTRESAIGETLSNWGVETIGLRVATTIEFTIQSHTDIDAIDIQTSLFNLPMSAVLYRTSIVVITWVHAIETIAYCALSISI